jgi:hypothetical protein
MDTSLPKKNGTSASGTCVRSQQLNETRPRSGRYVPDWTLELGKKAPKIAPSTKFDADKLDAEIVGGKLSPFALYYDQWVSDPDNQLAHICEFWRETNEPYYAWKAIQICTKIKRHLPSWTQIYLRGCAQRMIEAAQLKDSSDLREMLPLVLGFRAKRGRGHPLRPYGDDNEYDLAAMKFAIAIEKGCKPTEALAYAARAFPQSVADELDSKTLLRNIKNFFILKKTPRSNTEWKQGIRSWYFESYASLEAQFRKENTHPVPQALGSSSQPKREPERRAQTTTRPATLDRVGSKTLDIRTQQRQLSSFIRFWEKRCSAPESRLTFLYISWKDSGNPFHVWLAIDLCVKEQLGVAPWIRNYLAECAERMMREARSKKSQDLRKILPGALGFPAKRGPGHPLRPNVTESEQLLALAALKFANAIQKGCKPKKALDHASMTLEESIAYKVNKKILLGHIKRFLGVETAPRSHSAWKPLISVWYAQVLRPLESEFRESMSC